MKIRSNIIFPVFLFSPLLAFPLILKGMYWRQKKVFVYFSVFMALVSYLTFPASDLYRHFENYVWYKGMNLDSFILTLPGDFLTQSISYLFANMGIPFDYCRFLYTILFYMIVLKSFNILIDKSSIVYTNMEYFKRLIIYLLFVDFYTFVIGVRSGFATAFYLLGMCYLLENRSKMKSLILFVFSVCIHYSMLYLIVSSMALSLFYSFIPNRKWMRWMFLLIAYLISVFFVPYFGYYFSMHDMTAEASYFGDGKWGMGAADFRSFRGFVYVVVKRSIAVGFILLFLFNISIKSRWNKYIYGVVLSYVSTLSLATISSRIYLMLIALLSLYVYVYESLVGAKIKMINIFLFIAIFSTGVQLFARRDFIKMSNYERLFLPLPYILSQHYDISEIRVNLDYEDEIKR